MHLRPVYKRVFDLTFGLLLSILALPLIAVCAALIKICDRGPVLYRQPRVGEKGCEFEIVKLRTMSIDAESAAGPVWATASDPRVTSIGRILRKTHLDVQASNPRSEPFLATRLLCPKWDGKWDGKIGTQLLDPSAELLSVAAPDSWSRESEAGCSACTLFSLRDMSRTGSAS